MKFDQFIFCQALNFIRDHYGQHLAGQEDKLVFICSQYLMESYGITARSAERMSINALGEMEERREKLNIESFGPVIYIRNHETRETYALTASMLWEIIPYHGMALKHQ